MPLETHYSLEHSNKVLKIVEKALRKTKQRITVEAWSNGREQGYYLSGHLAGGRGCCFAQQRNSDSIVVVFGKTTEFDVTTNMPNDERWQKMVELYPDEIAAASIADWMQTGVEPKSRLDLTKLAQKG